MTQGRAEYESTIPQGTDEGLDLWEAISQFLTFDCQNQMKMCVAIIVHDAALAAT